MLTDGSIYYLDFLLPKQWQAKTIGPLRYFDGPFPLGQDSVCICFVHKKTVRCVVFTESGVLTDTTSERTVTKTEDGTRVYQSSPNGTKLIYGPSAMYHDDDRDIQRVLEYSCRNNSIAWKNGALFYYAEREDTQIVVKLTNMKKTIWKARLPDEADESVYGLGVSVAPNRKSYLLSNGYHHYMFDPPKSMFCKGLYGAFGRTAPRLSVSKKFVVPHGENTHQGIRGNLYNFQTVFSE
jgi:hypothetical protein